MNKHPATKQFKLTVGDLRSVLRYFCYEYCYVTELTEKGNVHYHMWVYLKTKHRMADVLDSLKYNPKFGFSYVSTDNKDKSTLQKQEDTYKYMCKSIESTYRLIRSMQMVGHDDHCDVDIIIQQDEYDTSALDVKVVE